MPVEKYLHQSLAATGFAVLDSNIACMLRPDLWPGGGLVCAAEFSAAHRRNQFANVARTTRLMVRLDGIERPVMVLARSSQRLAERIEEVTGFRMLEVIEGERGETGGQPLPRREHTVPADVDGLHGQFTEPPRTCTQCDKRLVDGRCQAAARGEFHQRPPHYRPTANHPRRCVHYVPGYQLLTGDHVDMRTGGELWPELLRTPAQAAQAANTIKALVTGMLKQGARPASEVFRAAEDAGVSARSVQRAAEGLGVIKTKSGFCGGWVWSLPEGAKVAA